MKKREDIVQKFSTFLSFGDNNSSRNSIWQADPGLQRYMKSLVQSDPEAKEEFWAWYFLKILKGVSKNEGSTKANDEQDTKMRGHNKQEVTTLSLATPKVNLSASPNPTTATFSLKAEQHLSAYLQEACLWAAQRIYHRFKFLQHKYPLEEYFQIANSATNPPTKLFKNFNLEQSQTNIEGYARTAILRFIADTIYRQDLEAKRAKFSDYGLLKDLSIKELREALASKGINSCNIDSYCLVWQCFDEIFQPNQGKGSRSITPPDQNQLEQISACYNQRCNQLNFPTASVSGKKISEMLSTCIQAARDYRTKSFFPLEDYDKISEPVSTPWDTLMQEEEWEQVYLLVSKLFSAMPETGQTMLKLWQGLSLTQTEMATVLKNKYPELQKQYQVARHLGRYTKNLLGEFANDWKKIHPEISLNGDKDIERLKEAMTECLQVQSKKSVYSILEKILEQYSREEKLLISSQCLNLNEQEIAERLNITPPQVSNRLREVRESFTKAFKNEMENRIGFPRKSLESVNTKMVSFVDEWLKTTSIICINEENRDDI